MNIEKLNTEKESRFWEKLEELVAASGIVIDRPKGSAHPRFPKLIFPLDYGYLKDTAAMDGGGIDVWVGSLPEKEIVAVICTVDMLKKDSEIKILCGCSAEEAETILAFHNSGPQAAIIMRRPGIEKDYSKQRELLTERL